MGTWQMHAIRVQHDPVDEAFGYRFNTAEHRLVISGDTTPCQNLINAPSSPVISPTTAGWMSSNTASSAAT
jgi:ribonuclease BN (tRNA processing enzyme)